MAHWLDPSSLQVLETACGYSNLIAFNVAPPLGY